MTDTTAKRSLYERLLPRACEAFWRDVKYPMMARNYRYVGECSFRLKQAGRDVSALETWIYHVKLLEREPVSLSAMRNTVFHLSGYWKKVFTDEQRRKLSKCIEQDPREALWKLRENLPLLNDPYLESSFIWKDTDWDRACFRTLGSHYCLQIHVDDAINQENPSLVDLEIHECLV